MVKAIFVKLVGKIPFIQRIVRRSEVITHQRIASSVSDPQDWNSKSCNPNVETSNEQNWQQLWAEQQRQKRIGMRPLIPYNLKSKT
jgi:hypothetical protein